MIRLALPGGLVLILRPDQFLAARAEIRAGGDSERIGLGLLALLLQATRELALIRLAERWTFAMVGTEALGTMVSAVAVDLASLMALATAAAGAVVSGQQAPTANAPAPPAPVQAPSRGIGDILDPYPGLLVDTGHGPETWPQFQERHGHSDAAALETWKVQAEAWEADRRG